MKHSIEILRIDYLNINKRNKIQIDYIIIKIISIFFRKNLILNLYKKTL